MIANGYLYPCNQNQGNLAFGVIYRHAIQLSDEF